MPGMTSAATSPDRAHVDEPIDGLLADFPPTSTDNIVFRGARYDRGLAWVHFPVGHGGLGLPPELNRHVEQRLLAAGARPAEARTFFIALAGPTIVTHGTEEQKRRVSPGRIRR